MNRSDRNELHDVADRLAWWIRTGRIAGRGSPATNASIDSKIAETRLELKMLRDRLMARKQEIRS